MLVHLCMGLALGIPYWTHIMGEGKSLSRTNNRPASFRTLPCRAIEVSGEACSMLSEMLESLLPKASERDPD